MNTQKGKLIIASNEVKEALLKQSTSEVADVKFMTKQEFFSHYFFSYDEKAYFYLQEKYHYHLDVCKKYLENMYCIEDREYQNKKLRHLRALKKELIDHKLLVFSPQFSKYLKRKEIFVYPEEHLEKYEEEVFKKLKATFVSFEEKYPLPKVAYEANDLEEELVFVASHIRKLIDQKVPLSKIHLMNVDERYPYLLKHIFSLFQIPVEDPVKYSLYEFPQIQKYLKTGILDLKNDDPVYKKLIQILSELSFLEEGEIKNKILIDRLKNTFYKPYVFQEAVQISSLFSFLEEDEYVFFLGFNQESFPKYEQDDHYILDLEKEEVLLYTTDEKNQREKEYFKKKFQSLPHLTLSYPKKDSFHTYSKSFFLDFLSIKSISINEDFYSYSNLYNQLVLAKKLDRYYKYNSYDSTLVRLYNTYRDIKYHTYSSSFTGIDSLAIQNYLKPQLTLSYTHLQNYYLCGFKYYVNHILKLDPFVESFQASIGTMFHEALKYMFCDDFDLEIFFARFQEEKEFTTKEKFFLKILKEDLKQTLHEIRNQKEYTLFQNQYLEHTLKYPIEKGKLSVILKGTIDKIMVYSQVEDHYFAIVDYKSGQYDTNFQKVRFGLNMQLPIYLYLIEKTLPFTNPIFAGFYYQNILLPKKKFGEKRNTLKLDGYTIEEEEIIKKLDNSYQNSDFIQGLKQKKDFTFAKSSKLLSWEEKEELLTVVEKKIEEAKDHILEGDFPINPKVLNKENISCKYCKYRDLCFVLEKDFVYLNIEEVA